MSKFHTGNPVPSAAIKDVFDNAQNFDDAVNGQAPTWRDRKGVERKSLAGALADLDAAVTDTVAEAQFVLQSLGYLVPVEYAAGLSVTSARFTVSYGGDTFAAIADQLPFVTGEAFDSSKWRVVQGVTSSELAASNGASRVGYSVTGGVVRDMLDKVMELGTVEDYGAIGDGVTNDGAALVAMAAATGGIIKLLDREYFVGNLTIPPGQVVSITGKGMPRPDSGLSKLRAGTVLIGGVNLRANTVRLQDLGVDSGTGRGGAATGAIDGIVVNARVGEAGIDAQVMNVAYLGYTEEFHHAVLVQGYGRNTMRNVYCALCQYGLVVKGRNATISDVSGDKVKTALVYPKSDTADLGGGVGDASAGNFEIANVQLRAGSENTTSSAVYVHASTLSFASARINNIAQAYGHSAVRFQGGGTTSSPAVSRAAASNVSADRCQYIAFVGGFAVDWRLSGLSGSNVATGRAVWMDSISNGWAIDGVSMTITESSITGTRLFDCFGVGQWDNVIARNPYLTMEVGMTFGQLSSVSSGKVVGNCKVSSDIALAGINGASAGTPVPTVRVLPGSVVAFYGRFSTVGLTNNAFCNLPIGTGKQAVFSCGAIGSGGSYTTVAVRLNDFQLTIEPSVPSGLQVVDLAGIFLR